MTSKHSIYYFHCFIITGLTSFRLINISFLYLGPRDFEPSSMARWRKRIFWSPANNLIYLYRVYLHHLSAYHSAIPGNEKRTKVVNLSNPNSWNTNARTIRDFLVRLYVSRCPQRTTKNLEHRVPIVAEKNSSSEFADRWYGFFFFIKLITRSRENIVDHFWFKTLLLYCKRNKEKQKRRKDWWKIKNFFFEKDFYET